MQTVLLEANGRQRQQQQQQQQQQQPPSAMMEVRNPEEPVVPDTVTVEPVSVVADPVLVDPVPVQPVPVEPMAASVGEGLKDEGLTEETDPAPVFRSPNPEPESPEKTDKAEAVAGENRGLATVAGTGLTAADAMELDYPMKLREPKNDVPADSQAAAADDKGAGEGAEDDPDSAERTFSLGPVLPELDDYLTKGGEASVPSSHPARAKIVDALVEGGVEEEAERAWERQFRRLREYRDRNGDCDVPSVDEGLGKWVRRQRDLYAKYGPGGEGGCPGEEEREQRHRHQKQQQPQQKQQLEQQQQHQKQQQDQQPPQQPPHLDSTNDDPSMSSLLKARYASRFERLAKLGLDFTTPLWDVRLRELTEYKETHGHCSPDVGYPKLGIWVVSQRLNIKKMPKERAKALDKIGFVWNHNRTNRSQKAWDKKYTELLEYIKQNGHCNVPATYRHSPLGTWVGKQREEYKKLKDKRSSQLDKYRIDKLNEVKFQWSLQSWTVISWDDRYEALKRFKEKHGHCKVPRNHPDFGNWPAYQKAQYKLFKDGKKSKITKEKVHKLIQIGFLETEYFTGVPQVEPLSNQKGYDDPSYEWTMNL
ncbi:hypothetical protein ACHAWF_006928 [Thalassiosira exigua]